MLDFLIYFVSFYVYLVFSLEEKINNYRNRKLKTLCYFIK